MKGIVLAFDATASSYSVALYKNKESLAEVSKKNTLTHSQTLLPTIKDVLEKAEMTFDEVEKIALTVGPGSFTGLKIAVSTAKGLAFEKNLPCYPLSTLSALAYGQTDFDGIICTSLDARRNMVYNALFFCREGVVTRLTEDRQISLAELATELMAQPLPICIVGDGAELVKNVLEKDVFLPKEKEIIFARGIVLAADAEKTEAVLPENLAPCYLRKPQAEREREEKLKENIK